MQSKKKISIIGAGNVGSTIAYTLMQQGTCSEILLVDINRDKAEGESLDLAQCAACFPSVKVRFGEYEDAAGSDIVIATLGVGRKPGQSRLDLAKINVGIIESVMPKVAKIAPDAIYIIVSNPVDVLTYVTVRCTGLPASRVVGTGTLLDSNRLSQAIAEYLDVDIKSVNSYVFGEHGDQCFVPWSLCTVGGVPVKTYAKELFGEEADIDGNFKDLYDKVVKSGAKVIQLKGATFYAIAASVAQLVEAIISNSNKILPVSTHIPGADGKDICTGVPCFLDGNGIKRRVAMPLTEEEEEKFKEKVERITETYCQLGIR